MISFKRKNHNISVLNTSSLPDLIFTVLFFFMIVTHMNKVNVKVNYHVPSGNELNRFVKNPTTTYIFIGQKNTSQYGLDHPIIQINDKIVQLSEVSECIISERQNISAKERKDMTVTIKADRHTKMFVIDKVKDAIKNANISKINYSAEPVNDKLKQK